MLGQGDLCENATSRDGAERSPCLRWSPIVGGGDLPRRAFSRKERRGRAVVRPRGGLTFDRGALSLLRGLAVQSARNQEGIHHGSFTPVQMCLFSSTPGVGRICTCE